MRILIRLATRSAWQWHASLIEEISACGHTVDVVASQEPPPLAASCRLLLWLEQIAFRLHLSRPSAQLSPAAVADLVTTDDETAAEFDCVIDLTGEASDFARRTLTPLFCGEPGVDQLLSSLLSHELPWLAVADSNAHIVAPASLIALGDPCVLSRGLDSAFARMTELIVKSLRPSGLSRVHSPTPQQRPTAKLRVAAKTAGFAAGLLSAKIASRLNRLCEAGPMWQVGIRNAASSRTMDRFVPHDFRWMSCDPKQYLADPFMLAWRGQRYLFVEDFAHAHGRGVISVASVDDQCNIGELRVVLEEPFHLSYPFVFENDGHLYMIPETREAGQIRLYRAEEFPYKWKLHSILIDGVSASDATLVRFDNRFWLFASTSAPYAADWDTLGLFYAPELHGPWRPHPCNPVLIDAGCARPAGAMTVVDGRVHRLAQDCRGGYGAGLAFCQVTRLDLEGFEQVVEARLRPQSVAGVQGLHTYNHAAGLELIDALMPRYKN